MSKVLIILLIGVLGWCHGRGQSTVAVTGFIRDSTGIGLAQATIRLAGEKDTIHLINNSNGHFSAKLPANQIDWDILVSIQGYRSYQDHIHISATTRTFTLPPIILQPEYQELATVTIHREQPLTIKTDTLEYHAGAYVMREGATLGDWIKRLPAVFVTIDSSVFVMGQPVKKALIDGKEYFGSDIRTALRNLPFDLIDKIELIDDYGDQARLTGIKTGEPEKILNIVLKAASRNVLFGNIEAGPGSQDQYILVAEANMFDGDRKASLQGGFTDNYPFGKERARFLRTEQSATWPHGWSTNGNAGLAGSDYLIKSGLQQNINFSSGQTSLDQNTVTQGTFQNQYAAIESVFAAPNDRQIKVSASLIHQNRWANDQTSSLSMESDSSLVKSIQTVLTNRENTEQTSLDSKLNFDKVQPISNHRFSIDAELKYTINGQAGSSNNQTAIYSDSMVQQAFQYRLANRLSTWDFGGTMSYYFPLGPGSQLQAGYTAHQTSGRISRSWTQPNPSLSSWQPVDSLSGTYNLHIFDQGIFSSYLHHSGKLDLRLSFTAEPGELKGTIAGKGTIAWHRYLGLLPSGSITISPDKAQHIDLDYSSSVTPPELQQLNPVADIINPQFPVVGNPDLKPSTSESLHVSYSYNSIHATRYTGFSIGFSYSHIKNQVVPVITRGSDTSAVAEETSYSNNSQNSLYRLDWRYNPPGLLSDHLKISLNGGLWRELTTSITDNVHSKSTTVTLQEELNAQYMLSDKFESNLFANFIRANSKYQTPGTPLTIASALTAGMSWTYRPFIYWMFQSGIVETWSTGAAQRLTPVVPAINASLEHSFLRKRQLIVKCSVLNLLNAASGINQTVTSNPLTITQRRTSYLGRNGFLTVQWKFEHQKKPVQGKQNNIR